MRPSVLYSIFLAGAFTVSALPVQLVDDVTKDLTGKVPSGVPAAGEISEFEPSVTTGDINVLSHNSNTGVDDTSKVGTPNPEDVIPSDPLNAAKDVDPLKAVKDAGAPLPEVDAESLPEGGNELPTDGKVQIIKQLVSDDNLATFKGSDGLPVDMKILGAVCCENIEQVSRLGVMAKCIKFDCELIVTGLKDGENKVAAIFKSNPDTGALMPEVPEEVNTPDAPQVDATTADTLLKGVQVDQVNVVVKRLSGQEKVAGTDAVPQDATKDVAGVIYLVSSSSYVEFISDKSAIATDLTPSTST